MNNEIINPPLCIGCKYFKRKEFKHDCAGSFFGIGAVGFSPEACMHPNNENLVDGTPRDTHGALRYSGQCGREGKWFEVMING